MFDETRGPYYYYIGDLIPTSVPWRVTWVGQEVDEDRSPTEDTVLMDYPQAMLISAPPRIGMGDYLTYEPGTGIRWRRAPARQLRWDREGIHALFGVPGGALLVILAAFAGNVWHEGIAGAIIAAAALAFGLGVIGIITWLFLEYEKTEGQRISDFAYRDILGYKASTTFLMVVAGVVF